MKCNAFYGRGSYLHIQDRRVNMDLEKIIQTLSSGNPTPAELAELVALFDDEAIFAWCSSLIPDEVCRACQNVLYEYVHFQTAGGPRPRSAAWLEKHLAQCDRCKSLYSELYQDMSSVYDGALWEAETAAPQVTLPEKIWQEIKRADSIVRQLVGDIGIRINREGAFFKDFPGSLQLSLAPAAFRNSEAGPRQVEFLAINDPDKDISFQLSKTRAAENQVTLEVRVFKITDQQPVSDARVTLKDENQRILESSRVDRSGTVQFARKSPGLYQIEVRRQGIIWEFSTLIVFEEQ